VWGATYADRYVCRDTAVSIHAPRVGRDSDIQQTLIVQSQTSGRLITAGQFIATVPNGAATALFRVIVVEHRGDNRANEAYSELTCLAIDPSAPINASVAAGV
jgi:hypothetical protein